MVARLLQLLDGEKGGASVRLSLPVGREIVLAEPGPEKSVQA